MSLKKMIGNAFLKIGSALAIEKGEQDKIGEARQIFGTGMTSYLVEKIKDSINSPDVEVVSAIENGMTTIRAFHKDSPDRLWCKFGFYPDTNHRFTIQFWKWNTTHLVVKTLQKVCKLA